MMDLAAETPIDVAGIMQLFRNSRATVYRWFESGLENRKLRGKIYTTREEIERWSQTDAAAESDEDDTPPTQQRRSRTKREQQASQTLREVYGFK
jgi:hypothetical protein